MKQLKNAFGHDWQPTDSEGKAMECECGANASFYQVETWDAIVDSDCALKKQYTRDEELERFKLAISHLHKAMESLYLVNPKTFEQLEKVNVTLVDELNRRGS